jgi:hypothetical protein
MATSQLFGDSRDPAADCLDASVDHCIVPAFTSPSLSECMGSELGGSTPLAVENHPVQCVPLVDNGPMQPSTAPGADDGVSPRQSSCVVESQAHAESQQHVSPCQSSRVVVSQAHAGAAGTRPSPAESPGVAVSTPNHADQHLPGEGRDRSPGCANPVGLQAQDVEGAVCQFITAVRKVTPAAVSEAPATRRRAKPRVPNTEDGLPRRSARVSAQGDGVSTSQRCRHRTSSFANGR